VLRPVALFDYSPLKKGSYKFLTRPTKKVELISCEDTGKGAAVLLTNTAEYAGKKIEAAGAELTGVDCAAPRRESAMSLLPHLARRSRGCCRRRRHAPRAPRIDRSPLLSPRCNPCSTCPLVHPPPLVGKQHNTRRPHITVVPESSSSPWEIWDNHVCSML
jgi:hypothetical protein